MPAIVPTFAPSPQQSAIFDWILNGSGNLVCRAVAGAGKTTLLIQSLIRMSGSVGLFSFSKDIVTELKARVSQLDSEHSGKATIGTMHAVGFGAIRGIHPRCKIEGKGWKEKKSYIIAEKLNVPEDLRNFVANAVSKAKNIGIGVVLPFGDRQAWLDMCDHFDLSDLLPEDRAVPLTDALRFACLALKESVAMAPNLIDFDDMIYLPGLKGLPLTQYDWLLIDEAQDINVMRLSMIGMMLKPGGRLIAVGDDAQAIFGFTGADADALNRIQNDFNAISLPLSVSYRCAQSIVAEAQRFMPGIEAHPAAPMGTVNEVSELDFYATLAPFLGASDAVLCRNTKPLVTLAYGLLGRGIGCRIEGKDIGTGLKRLANKWKRVKTIGALHNRLDSYLETETKKAADKGHDYKIESVTDKVGCLKVIMQSLHDDDKIAALDSKIDSMFGDTKPGELPNVLTLSTIHKSKGREWHRVIWWGRNVFQPSKYARQPWQVQQETNLSYVATTRAKSELIIVDVANQDRACPVA